MATPALCGKSVLEISDWIRLGPIPKQKVRRHFLEARKAAGHGHPDEQMIRLMVWAGTKLPTKEKHSRIRNPIDIMEEGSAWCDQHCKVVAYFAYHLFGVEGRELVLHHSDGSNKHTVLELEFGGDGYHLFDCHADHQRVYRGPGWNIMNWEQISASGEAVDHDHWWAGANGVGKEGFFQNPPDRLQLIRGRIPGQVGRTGLEDE